MSSFGAKGLKDKERHCYFMNIGGLQLTNGPERDRGKTRTVTLQLTVCRLVSHSLTVLSPQGNTL